MFTLSLEGPCPSLFILARSILDPVRSGSTNRPHKKQKRLAAFAASRSIILMNLG